MARVVTSTAYGAANYSPPSIPYALAMRCRETTRQSAGAVARLGMFNSGGSNVGEYIESTVGGFIQGVATAGSDWVTTGTLALPSTGTWFTVILVVASATSRTLYLDGSAGSTLTTSRSPAGIDKFTFNDYISGGSHFPGDGIWEIAEADALPFVPTAEQMTAYAAGYSGKVVWPLGGTGRDHWDLFGNGNELGLYSGNTITLTGSPAKADHPRTVYRHRRGLTTKTVSAGLTFSADQGTVTVTGQNATALLSVALAQGTVAVTGQAATMRYSMAAAQGTVGVTGQAATLTFGMLAGQGTVAITGQDATLTGISGLVLTADTGFVTVSGQDAAMNWSVALAQGAMSVTGQAASVMFGMAAGLGSVSILGQAASVTGATDQSSAVGKPKRSKKRKRVYVGEQVFWSDQKLEIALAVKALQDRRAEERQAKAKKAEQAALTKARTGLGAVVAPSFDFQPVEAQGQAIAAELQGALDLAQEEDDIACLLLCS